MSKASVRLERLFTEIAVKLPWAADFLNWLRTPKNAIVRLPVAFLLILGGIFSFLPLLGIWMLPLGLLILAIDVVVLQEPVTRWIIIAKRKFSEIWRWLKTAWQNMRRWWS